MANGGHSQFACFLVTQSRSSRIPCIHPALGLDTSCSKCLKKLNRGLHQDGLTISDLNQK